MEDIIALTKLLTKQKVKQIKIITEHGEFQGKSKQLYESIKEGLVISDEQAIEILGYKNINSAGYLKLKQRLLQRLINTIFFIDINEYSKSSYEKVLHKCYKNWAAGKLVADRLQRKTSISIYESVLRSAMQYDISDLILIICKDLKRNYSVFDYNPKKQEYYSKLVDENLQFYTQEIFVETIYSKLAQHVIKVDSKKEVDIKSKYQNDIEILIKSLNSNSRYYYNYYAYNSIYYFYYLLNDNNALELYSKRALEFFKTKKGFSPVAKFSFSQKLGVAYLHSSKIIKAKETFIETLKTNPTPASLAWYSVHNYLFIVNIILKLYLNSYEILQKATSHSGFEKLNARFKEPWLIKEAYIHFLIRMGKIDPEESTENSLRPFRMGRFLNEVPNYSKDKRGLNIAILIVQMLFLILDKKYGKVIDRIDSLKQYSYRYLRKNETFRANCFIKMLLKLPDANYHPVAVRRHTADLHKSLLESSMNLSETSPETEIIPYENLWEIVMELLEGK